MKFTAVTLFRKLTWLAIVGVCAIGVGAGCRRDEAPARAGAEQATSPNPGSSPDNRVLRLDGTTAYMRVPDSPSLHSLTNGMTLEVCFKAGSFYKQNGAVNSLLRKNIEAGGENFFLRFRIRMGKPMLEMSAGGQVIQAPHNFEPGSWYHLAGSYDGRVMTLFVNGVAIGSRRFASQIDIDDSDLMIGKGDPDYSSGEFFNGDIDDIRIWNVVRSADQIQASMNTRLTGKEPGLVACWTFDDGTARDSSTNGNNAFLDGNTRIVTVGTAGATLPGSSQTDPAR
jgi:hypothetical protein